MRVESCSNPSSCINPFESNGEGNCPVEVYYARSSDPGSAYLHLGKYLSAEEMSRANKFHYEDDRRTYMTCHAVLRLVLSKRLKTAPQNMIFIGEKGSKPALPGNPAYFNVAHTRNAFAIAVTGSCQVGIDLEDLSRNFDYVPIMKCCFTAREQAFVLESQQESAERFLMLWTRKEAYLKALGTGLRGNLKKLAVFQRNRSLNNYISHAIFKGHFICSLKVLDHYMSIATPEKPRLVLNHLTEGGLFHLLSD